MFGLLKTIHVTAVVITATLFALRGYWMLTESARLRHPVIRVVPHVNDTVLFASAVAMAVTLGANPLATPWLGAKLVALVAYILLGHVALRRGPTRRIRAMALVAALAVLGYIVAVALTRDPVPWRAEPGGVPDVAAVPAALAGHRA